jgi:hypothetical protein
MAKGLRQVNLRINEGRCWVAAVLWTQWAEPSPGAEAKSARGLTFKRKNCLQEGNTIRNTR